MFANSSILTALRAVKNTLNFSLKTKYNIDKEEITDSLLKIHGLRKDNFDFINNIENLIEAVNINDNSIDDNSNKTDKTIESIHQEVFNPIKKIIGFRYLYRELKKLYGKNEAKRLSGELYDLSLAIADSTNIARPYCYSFDFSKLVLLGRDFGQLKSKPCKRIGSYTSALCETIHQLSSVLAGAVAIGSYFLDICHLLIYKENYSLTEIKTSSELRKYVENEMQQLVHSLNHLSRNSSESPFTNMSIFDRVKLKNLLSKENYDWYFDEEIFENNDKFKNDFVNYNSKTNYIIDYIMELQEIFLQFFDKGDPLSNGLPYRFPILTNNLSKKKVNDKYILEDKDFLNSLCKKDIFRYNIFCSEGTKLASCCRLLSDAEMFDLSSQVNSFGGGSLISVGSHRVVTVNFYRIALECKDINDFYVILKNRILDSIKILKAHKILLKDLTTKGLQNFIKQGWINLDRMFSTVGILGIVESEKLLKSKFKDLMDNDIIKDMLILLNSECQRLSKEFGLYVNIEQIPGESFAVRLCKADKAIYGEEYVPYSLYSNQFVPLWEDTTIYEKFEIDGKYNKLITGGGIVHYTIGEKITTKQAEKVINYAVESGCEHFALNSIYSICENEHTTFGKNENCSLCGGKIVDYMTRVVGFFTRVSSWNEVRREWEFPRRKVNGV